MLLRPDQRIERARSLLGTALGVTLVNTGWILHSRPGEFHLSRGDERLNPYELISQLSDGTISKDAWAAKCRDLGIEGISFVIAARNDQVQNSGAARSGA